MAVRTLSHYPWFPNLSMLQPALWHSRWAAGVSPGILKLCNGDRKYGMAKRKIGQNGVYPDCRSLYP